jgi:hypothetical protein
MVLPHWSEIVSWADHWQSLLAGVLGFAAAIGAVVLTLRSEHRRSERRTRAMRRALLAEMWGFAGQALSGYQRLAAILQQGAQIRIRDLEDAARFPEPVIFPNIAGELGALGEVAHHVVHFYQRLRAAMDAVDRVRRNFDERQVGPANPEDLAEALLEIAEVAAPLLPRLRVSRDYSRADTNFAIGVERARAEWVQLKAALAAAGAAARPLP